MAQPTYSAWVAREAEVRTLDETKPGISWPPKAAEAKSRSAEHAVAAAGGRRARVRRKRVWPDNRQGDLRKGRHQYGGRELLLRRHRGPVLGRARGGSQPSVLRRCNFGGGSRKK